LNDPVKTKIREGGLRYQSKATGSEFSGPFGGTMSCILCGKHMPRGRLASVMLGGRRQMRCRDGC
jgi:hypothetical protein